MKRLRSFTTTALLGGLTVLLPIGIFAAITRWVFGVIKSAVRPFTDLLIAHTELQELLAILVVLAIMSATCFITGIIVKTQVGRFVHSSLEERILKVLPGYGLIKETVRQFLGKSASAFSTVALVRPIGASWMTGFVTESHANGWFSVFVPTGPNPTSGNIFHLPADRVQIVDVPVEIAMRSVIACGAGSAPLLSALHHPGQALPEPAPLAGSAPSTPPRASN